MTETVAIRVRRPIKAWQEVTINVPADLSHPEMLAKQYVVGAISAGQEIDWSVILGAAGGYSWETVAERVVPLPEPEPSPQTVAAVEIPPACTGRGCGMSAALRRLYEAELAKIKATADLMDAVDELDVSPSAGLLLAIGFAPVFVNRDGRGVVRAARGERA